MIFIFLLLLNHSIVESDFKLDYSDHKNLIKTKQIEKQREMKFCAFFFSFPDFFREAKRNVLQ